MGRALKYDEPSIFSVPDPKALKITFTEFGDRRAQYPFAEMRTGDYFEVEQSLADSARSSACNYGRGQEKEFTVRRSPENKYIWICRRTL